MNPERTETLRTIAAIGRATANNQTAARELYRLLDVLETIGWQTDEVGRVRQQIAAKS